jgi:hypothetical protein
VCVRAPDYTLGQRALGHMYEIRVCCVSTVPNNKKAASLKSMCIEPTLAIAVQPVDSVKMNVLLGITLFHNIHVGGKRELILYLL